MLKSISETNAFLFFTEVTASDLYGMQKIGKSTGFLMKEFTNLTMADQGNGLCSLCDHHY